MDVRTSYSLVGEVDTVRVDVNVDFGNTIEKARANLFGL